MATSVDLMHQRATVWTQMTEMNDLTLSENRDLTAEETPRYTALETELETLDARIERQRKLEATRAPDAPGGPVQKPEDRKDGDSDEDRNRKVNEAFRSWLKGGNARLSAEHRAIMDARIQALPNEARALSVGVDTAGGYLVPEDFRRQIESAMLTFGGMREVATVFQTDTGADLAIPTDDDTTNSGSILGENTTVSEQDVTVGQRVVRAYMYSSNMIKVPYTLLQDAAFNIESWLTDKLATRIGRATNTHFTTGARADRPTGITLDSTLGVTAASATAVTVDELINLEFSVDAAYRAAARWMFHSNTLRDLRKQKDGDGRYMWQPGMQAGNPNTLNGYSYTVNDDMPTMATTNVAILFGQLNKYLIRDVRGFTLLPLRERFADSLQVAFLGFSRHDGKLLDAGTHPVKHIVMA